MLTSNHIYVYVVFFLEDTHQLPKGGESTQHIAIKYTPPAICIRECGRAGTYIRKKGVSNRVKALMQHVT